MVRNVTIWHGRSFPLGATLDPEGVQRGGNYGKAAAQSEQSYDR
jgi:hypothetical protein